MKRRDFVLGGAAAALATWPAWLARAFDPAASCEPSERLQALFDRYRSARRNGTPLVVLIVPERDDEKWDHGMWFGQVLNHGDDETMAALALVTLACATRQELSRLVETDSHSAEPLFATIDTQQRPARARGYQVTVPQRPDRWAWKGEWEDYVAQSELAVDVQINVISAALRQAVNTALAQSTPPATDFAGERVARAILAGEAVSGSDVLRVARALYLRAQAVASERKLLLAGLATAVRSEVVSKQLSGSVWGVSQGCGTMIEGRDEQAMFACGMGHVPARSARFLYFLTRMPGESE